MSMRTDTSDLHPDLVIDDGGNDAPNVYWDEDRYAWVYRASAVNSCEKQLILFRQGYEGAPPPESMLRRFRDGHLHEPAILAELQAQRPGWKVQPVDPYTGTQYETELWVKEPDREAGVTGIVIVGHTDGLAINPLTRPDSRICEAKALSKANWEKFTRLWEQDGGKERVWREYPYYRDSITVYMASLEVPVFYAVKNKDTGEVFVRDLDEPPGDIDALMTRIRVIDARAAREQIPDLCDRRSFPCPQYRFCKHTEGDDEDDPEAIMAAAMGQSPAKDQGDDYDPAELEVLCREYDSFRAAQKEAEERKKETGRKITESFLVSNDQVESAGFKVRMKQHTSRRPDLEAMRADGIDVDAYMVEKVTEYPAVTAKRKKGKK